MDESSQERSSIGQKIEPGISKLRKKSGSGSAVQIKGIKTTSSTVGLQKLNQMRLSTDKLKKKPSGRQSIHLPH